MSLIRFHAMIDEITTALTTIFFNTHLDAQKSGILGINMHFCKSLSAWVAIFLYIYLSFRFFVENCLFWRRRPEAC